MSFAFANKLGEKVLTSYNNPYDAYQNPVYETEIKLCLVSDNKVIRILDTKMISVKWAVSCAKHVLHIFEDKYPDDKRPRKAIEAVSNWIKDPSEKNKNACKDASYVYKDVYTNQDVGVLGASYYANATVYYFNKYTKYAANSSVMASTNKSLEIKWQRKKFNQIIYEDILVLLVKSQYQRINSKLVRKIPKELLEYIASFITG